MIRILVERYSTSQMCCLTLQYNVFVVIFIIAQGIYIALNTLSRSAIVRLSVSQCVRHAEPIIKQFFSPHRGNSIYLLEKL